jgi:hypothetical protein
MTGITHAITVMAVDEATAVRDVISRPHTTTSDLMRRAWAGPPGMILRNRTSGNTRERVF